VVCACLAGARIFAAETNPDSQVNRRHRTAKLVMVISNSGTASRTHWSSKKIASWPRPRPAPNADDMATPHQALQQIIAALRASGIEADRGKRSNF